jgi:hypothetical protein
MNTTGAFVDDEEKAKATLDWLLSQEGQGALHRAADMHYITYVPWLILADERSEHPGLPTQAWRVFYEFGLGAPVKVINTVQVEHQLKGSLVRRIPEAIGLGFKNFGHGLVLAVKGCLINRDTVMIRKEQMLG